MRHLSCVCVCVRDAYLCAGYPVGKKTKNNNNNRWVKLQPEETGNLSPHLRFDSGFMK